MRRGTLLSKTRADERLGAVFEYDGETGYFYLYDLTARDGNKVLCAIHIFDKPSDLEESDLEIGWDEKGSMVGLLIRGTAWAAFNADTLSREGGDYRAGTATKVSAVTRRALERAE
jgi:hypothetical protein